MEGVRWLPVVAVAAAALGAGMWFGARPSGGPPIELPDVGPAPPSRSMTVYVSGAVVEPGLVLLAPGSRVADALAAAGGATADAAPHSVNLAAPVIDGQHVIVPSRREDVASLSDGRLHLNTADAEALEQLPGVGPVLAARIVAYREQNGPFALLEDLLAVGGIGEVKLAELRAAGVVP